MKKKQRVLLPALAIVLSAAAMAVSLFTLSQLPQDQTHLIDDLYRENQTLRSQVDELNARLDQFITVATLQEWELNASPWADSTGADVTFTAVPSEFRSGVSAELLVLLEGKQVSSTPCIWDGSRFTATVPLNAADGYSYYCLLSAPGGTQQLTLTAPDSPDAGIPVYLQSALQAFCNLVITDWTQNADSLDLSSAYAQVQLPQISAAGDLQIISAELVLRLNGENSTHVPITLNPSEVANSFDATLIDLSLPMPELENADSLELYLEVVLSDGRHMQAFGLSWYQENGRLQSAVG